MILPIVKIPSSIANSLSAYADLFPRSETFQPLAFGVGEPCEHIQEYCTGLVMSTPTAKRLMVREAFYPADGPLLRRWSIPKLTQ